MREFTIGEISSVDEPAQKGALAVLMKRNRDVPTVVGMIFDAIVAHGAGEDIAKRQKQKLQKLVDCR